MTYWPKKDFISFDTETTGLDFENDRIIQAAMCIFHGGQLVWQFNWLLNTDYPSSAEATAVHGITDEYRKEKGIEPGPVFQAINGLITRLRENQAPLVIFNAPFDLIMLRKEFERAKISFARKGLYIVDPLVIDRHYQVNVPVFTKPYMRLQKMAARFGVIPPSHDALDDAKTAGYIAIEQSFAYKGIRSANIPALHENQRLWYEQWCSKFVDFANKKKFEVRIPSWPFGIDAADAQQEQLNAGKEGIDVNSAMDSMLLESTTNSAPESTEKSSIVSPETSSSTHQRG
jgi:DNA polymerase III subunit epsilon